jgi:hypothetical protein
MWGIGKVEVDSWASCSSALCARRSLRLPTLKALSVKRTSISVRQARPPENFIPDKVFRRHGGMRDSNVFQPPLNAAERLLRDPDFASRHFFSRLVPVS